HHTIDPVVLKTFPRWYYLEQHTQPTCAICMEEFIPACLMRTLPCLHHFHVDCIDRWLLEESSECPSCKTDFGCG
ncbi:ring finger protein, putative, partial [Perkinsus marinus ATCC 50983]